MFIDRCYLHEKLFFTCIKIYIESAVWSIFIVALEFYTWAQVKTVLSTMIDLERRSFLQKVLKPHSLLLFILHAF